MTLSQKEPDARLAVGARYRTGEARVLRIAAHRKPCAGSIFLVYCYAFVNT
jgi:hypothetical protein